jgi:hypothetical protein
MKFKFDSWMIMTINDTLVAFLHGTKGATTLRKTASFWLDRHQPNRRVAKIE